MTQRRIHIHVLAFSLTLAACGVPDADKPVTVVASPRPNPVVIPAPPPPPPESPALVAEAPAAPAAAPVADTSSPFYYCVTGSASDPQRTPIAFAPSVNALCRKAPEMGPCQYERDACRRQGGKVVTAAGVEITLQTEAEYDRRVLRVRMKSN
ncbi:MAG: hypothetical protein ABI537_14975 [Casimicrobiaceae bacterium]